MLQEIGLREFRQSAVGRNSSTVLYLTGAQRDDVQQRTHSPVPACAPVGLVVFGAKSDAIVETQLTTAPPHRYY